MFFFVPSTNQTATLEDMNYIFGRKLLDHADAQLERIYPRKKIKSYGPKMQWYTTLRDKTDRNASSVLQQQDVEPYHDEVSEADAGDGQESEKKGTPGGSSQEGSNGPARDDSSDQDKIEEIREK